MVTADMKFEGVILESEGNEEYLQDIQDIAVNLSSWISAVGEENLQVKIENADDLQTNFPWIATELKRYVDGQEMGALVKFAERIYEITDDQDCIDWSLKNLFHKIDAYVQSKMTGTEFKFEGVDSVDNWLQDEPFLRKVAKKLEDDWTKESYIEFLLEEKEQEVQEKLVYACGEMGVPVADISDSEYVVEITYEPRDYEEVAEAVLTEALRIYDQDDELSEEMVWNCVNSARLQERDYYWLDSFGQVGWEVRIEKEQKVSEKEYVKDWRKYRDDPFMRRVENEMEKSWDDERFVSYLKEERYEKIEDMLADLCHELGMLQVNLREVDYSITILQAPHSYEESAEQLIDYELLPYGDDMEMSEEMLWDLVKSAIAQNKDCQWLEYFGEVKWIVDLILE